MNHYKQIINDAWENRVLLKESKTINCIHDVINLIDKGELRTAEPINKSWKINEWVKKAVILYFPYVKWKLLKWEL